MSCSQSQSTTWSLTDARRHLETLPGIQRIQVLSKAPTGQPALAVCLADDTGQRALNVALVHRAWHVTETLEEWSGRWVRVALCKPAS
jgi:hypothetical protein